MPQPGSFISLDTSEMKNLGWILSKVLSEKARKELSLGVVRPIARYLRVRFKGFIRSYPSRMTNFTRRSDYSSFADTAAYSVRATRGKQGVRVIGKVGVGRNKKTGSWSRAKVYVGGKGPFTFRRTVLQPSKYWHLVARGTKPHAQPNLDTTHPGYRPPDIRAEFVALVQPEVNTISRREIHAWLLKNHPLKYKYLIRRFDP